MAVHLPSACERAVAADQAPIPSDAPPERTPATATAERPLASRASGQLAAAVSNAIPTVEPIPNRATYANRTPVEGRLAITSAVSAPLPARPCTTPTRRGLRTDDHPRRAASCGSGSPAPGGPAPRALARATRHIARAPSTLSIAATTNASPLSIHPGTR